MSFGAAARLSKVICVSLAAVFLVTALAGCGDYRSQWLDIMNAYQKRLNEDNKKLKELQDKGDLTETIKILNSRMNYIGSVMEKVSALNPPPQYLKLHAITLYFLLSVREQWQAQNDLYEAAVTGKPTTDLENNAKDQAAKANMLTNELSFELGKNDMELEVKPEGEPPQHSAPAPQPTQ